jgi:hypothetical protein
MNKTQIFDKMTDSPLKSIQQSERQVKFVSYLNTVFLTLITGLAMLIFITVSTLRKEISSTQQAMIRFQVIQDHNTVQIDDVDARVKILEITNLQDIKNWIDLNYVRKPQK